jgi:hypothetical protein
MKEPEEARDDADGAHKIVGKDKTGSEQERRGAGRSERWPERKRRGTMPTERIKLSEKTKLVVSKSGEEPVAANGGQSGGGEGRCRRSA